MMTNSKLGRFLILGLLPFLSVGFLVGAAEVGFRVYQFFTEGIPLVERSVGAVQSTSPYTPDSRMGWRATIGFQSRRQTKTANGAPYEVVMSQQKLGFRLFGDVSSKRPKLFVIGDSFTHATDASDDKTYYSVLRDRLDLEVFAYGIGGAGTLQEFLAFDEYFNIIKPDVLLWQFCSNDFVNNALELEMASTRNNNGMIRPYFVDGEVKYVLPKGRFVDIRETVTRYSRFLAAIFHRIDKLQAVTSMYSIEDDIVREGFQHAGFRRAVEVTDHIMGKVRQRAGDIPILNFSCDGGAPYNEAFKRISAHHNMKFLEGVGEVIQEYAKNGVDVFAEDHAHWNEEGHRIVGDFLAGLISGLVPSRGTSEENGK